jgi:hypothetical protein
LSEQSDQTAKSRLCRLAGILCHLILVVALTGLARAQEDLEFLEREAALFTDASKIPQAEAMLERKLALQEKSLGPNNPDVATTLFELVRLYRKQDDREREQQAATRALKIREGTLGPVSLKVAESLEQLATCKNLPEHSLLVAIADLNRALVIREKALPPNDPQIAQILMDLGDKSIDTDKKEKDYLKAEAILEKSAPESDMMLTVLVDLSSFYRETGSLKNADEMMRRYTELSNKRYGIGRGGLILYRERDQSTNAAKLIAEGDSLCRETFSTNHEWMFYSTHPDLMFLATHHYQSFFNICSVTDRSRAEGLYQSALREEIGHLNADFRTTWEIRKRLLTLYLSTGRFDKAEPVYRDSLAYWKTHPPEPYVVDSEYPRNIENNYFREEMTSFCFELAHYNKPQWARPIAEMLRRRYLDRLRQNADQEDQNSSRRSAALVLNENLKILWTIAHHPDLDDAPGSAANEAFMVADQVRIGAAGAALTRAALRAQPNDAASSAAERQREELVAQLRSLKNREAVWQTRPDYYRKELDTNSDSAREIARNISTSLPSKSTYLAPTIHAK